MEPITLTLLLGIVGTGVLTKVGENITDELSPKVRELFGVIQRKLPQTKTAKAIAAGQDLDYEQTVIDVEPIESDPEVIKLADEVRLLIAQNQVLQTKLDAEVAKVMAKNTYINQGNKSSPQIIGNVGGITINYGKDSD